MQEGELSRLLRDVAQTPNVEPRLSGKKLGRYTLEERIGRGGMGEVWLASDERLERKVAIKLLSADALDDADRRRRFFREARALAGLSHPGVCAIHDVDEADSVPFIVMELVSGPTLRELIQGGVPVRRATEIALDIAHALACAHDAGVVHRDLKPENVKVPPTGRAKVLDFGLARIISSDGPVIGGSTATAEGVVLGTLPYMSPEQIEGKATDARSDVFSFGVLLHEVVSGAWPWAATNESGRVAAILRDEPRPLPAHIDPSVARVIHRCLEKEPARRYANAREIVAALESAPRSHRPARVRAVVTAFCVAAIVLAFGARELWIAPPSSGSSAPRVIRTQQLTALVGHEVNPAMTSDAATVVYAHSSADGYADLYMQRVGGARSIRLTETTGDEGAPRFSPDGTTIAYHARFLPGAKVASIWLVGATGESPRKLVDGLAPSWFPDGRSLAFATAELWYSAGADSRVEVIDLSSERRRTVVERGAFEPSVSPDGRHIAFVHRVSGTRRDIAVVSSDGSTPPWRITDDDALEWLPVWQVGSPGTELEFAL